MKSSGRKSSMMTNFGARGTGAPGAFIAAQDIFPSLERQCPFSERAARGHSPMWSIGRRRVITLEVATVKQDLGIFVRQSAGASGE